LEECVLEVRVLGLYIANDSILDAARPVDLESVSIRSQHPSCGVGGSNRKQKFKNSGRPHTSLFASSTKLCLVAVNLGGSCGGVLYCDGAIVELVSGLNGCV
jgi:hypothetical protein